MSYQNAEKCVEKYVCENCDYYTDRKYDFDRHVNSKKHKLATMSYSSYYFAENAQNKNFINYECGCGKKYKYKQGLSNHKKKCEFIKKENIVMEDNNQTSRSNSLEKLVVQLMTENNDIKNNLLRENIELRKKLDEKDSQLIELIPKIGNITNNTINNKLNINLFLNEKCKDAMTIDEFVNNVEISIKNLLTTKSRGIGIGLSEIINENMNKLSVYERPIHCTDKKREILYVKNKTWEKDSDKTHTTRMLKALQSQQFKDMKKWIQEHPNYNDDEQLKLEYMLLVNKCSSSFDDQEKKLFKNICDNTYVKDESVIEN